MQIQPRLYLHDYRSSTIATQVCPSAGCQQPTGTFTDSKPTPAVLTTPGNALTASKSRMPRAQFVAAYPVAVALMQSDDGAAIAPPPGVIAGLEASLIHPENGMQRADMVAALEVARNSNEVIMFRSTGSPSLHWIEKGYPTKNFHVKGKSADWGPQAGLIPFDGIYSKVGHKPAQAENGTNANRDGIKGRFAGVSQLTLSLQDLERALPTQIGRPPRAVVGCKQQIGNSDDYLLSAQRSGDDKTFYFRAVWNGAAYAIYAYPETLNMTIATAAQLPETDRLIPLTVMTSSEVGANNLPMCGDYDLMLVSPTWADYGSASTAVIEKPGLVFACAEGARPGQVYAIGTGLDKLLDMRLNTGARPRDGATDVTFQGWAEKDSAQFVQHPDIGNITPRDLRSINALNTAMGAVAAAAPFRRVHHGAEVNRNQVFGAITRAELERGEGFPITVFHPTALQAAGSPTAVYQAVSTFETLEAFEPYLARLNEAGHHVPKNWVWGMSIRDKYA